jgi:hypothetical protein
MNSQSQLNPEMRAQLIQSLIKVHKHLKLDDEILFLSINTFDRYCSFVDVPSDQLFLIGLTALRLACKYVGGYLQCLDWFVSAANEAYDKSQFIKMENIISERLDHKFCVMTTYSFLTLLLHFIDASIMLRADAIESLTLSVEEYELLQYKPSLVACAIIRHALKKKSGFDEHKNVKKEIIVSICDTLKRVNIFLINYPA